MNDGSTPMSSLASNRKCLPILQVSVEGNYKATKTVEPSSVNYPILLVVSVREDYWQTFQPEAISVNAVSEGEEESRAINLPVLKGLAHVKSEGVNTPLYLIVLGVNGPQQPVLLQMDSTDLVEQDQLINMDLLNQALSKRRGGLSIAIRQDNGQTHVKVHALEVVPKC